MFFIKKRKVKMGVTPNTLNYFSVVDILLQATSFIDGHFDGPFSYFRASYFNLIKSEMALMSNTQKVEHLEGQKENELKTLAALSQVLKEEVFSQYLDKMYSPEEQASIRNSIKYMPIKIPVAPINKVK